MIIAIRHSEYINSTFINKLSRIILTDFTILLSFIYYHFPYLVYEIAVTFLFTIT